MKYKFLIFIISNILSVGIWVRHKDKWFVPDLSLQNTFWPADGLGAILMGLLVGSLVFLITLFAHHYLSGNNYSTLTKTSLYSLLFLTLGLTSWALFWDYLEGTEQRRSERTLENFRVSFNKFDDFRSIEGDLSDNVKALIFNFYQSLWAVSSEPDKANVFEIAEHTTPKLADILFKMYSMEDSSLWKGFSWGVATLPCYGPFGSPIRFRIDSVSEIKDQFYKFRVWDPRKGGKFTRILSASNVEEKFYEITRVIAKVVIMDEGNSYNYACWRSNEQVSYEILVICPNEIGGSKVCGLTDTAGNWIYKDF